MPTSKKTKITKVSKTAKALSSPKKNAVKKSTKASATESTTSELKGLSAQVFDIAGKSQGTIKLPKELFGQSPNEKLLNQAIRVYFTNQSTHTAHVKTRSEVRGGGKKPWRQKGTGRARAGSIRSSIWVGGGKALGPRFRDVKLTLPPKMKKKALAVALSQKLKNGQVKIISNLESQQPKTKIISNLISKIGSPKSNLIVTSKPSVNVKLASRNIPNVEIDIFSNLNAYEIVKSKQVLFSKEIFK